MSEHAGHTAARPRFPYVAAALCAACVGVAAWTWMRYSYCWSLTVAEIAQAMQLQRTAHMADDLLSDNSESSAITGQAAARELVEGFYSGLTRWPARAYVEVNVVIDRGRLAQSAELHAVITEVHDPTDSQWTMWIRTVPEMQSTFTTGGLREFAGRVWPGVIPVDGPITEWWACVDTKSSRFTGASITGLVVGAAGVFVFAFFLVRWLRRRHPAA